MAESWTINVKDAVERENGTQLQELLQSSNKQSLDFTIGGLSPLTKAASYYTPKFVKQLLLAGANVDFADAAGETPLMVSAKFGNMRMCKLLLKNGANVNARNHRKDDLSVLCYSIRHERCNYKTIALLLEYGAQIYDPSKEFNLNALKASPLGRALEYKLPCILEMLLDHCHKINLRLPLAKLFHYSLRKWPAHLILKIEEYIREQCAIMILQQGCCPTPKLIMIYFHVAAREGWSNLMNLLIEINPHCLQGKWLINQEYPQGLAQNTDFISMLVASRRQPPSLAQLCKPVILAQLHTWYLRQGRIDELPLPKLLKTFLKKM